MTRNAISRSDTLLKSMISRKDRYLSEKNEIICLVQKLKPSEKELQKELLIKINMMHLRYKNMI